jgi:uncharacterized RDD family membrane protein YckC
MTSAVPARADQPAAPGGGTPRLVGGEAVEVDVRVARLGSRALALLLDIGVQAGVALVLGLLVAVVATGLGDYADGAWVEAAVKIVVVLVFVAFPTAVETLTNGRSPGKRALGLRVVREDGGPIRLRHALARALVGVAVEWPGLIMPPLTWLVSLLTMLFSERGRRLGDLAAGTIVVHERSPAAWGWVPAMPPQLASWAAGLDLSAVDDDLALAVRHFLARAGQIREPANGRIGYQLTVEVTTRLGQSPPPGTPPWMFLVAVLAERRRRAAGQAMTTRALTERIWPGFGRAPRAIAVLAARRDAPW